MMFGEKEIDLLQNGGDRSLFVCTQCGSALFEAGKKFEAGCGFPSFWLHLADAVEQKELNTYGRNRIQLLCRNCGQHLGHLFPNKHTPTGLRYCINAEAIRRETPGIKTKRKYMLQNQEHFEALKDFIRQHRSNESNFSVLYQKLEEEIRSTANNNSDAYHTCLLEIKEKQAANFTTAQENNGTAWPEFEQFVSEWEKAIGAAGKS